MKRTLLSTLVITSTLGLSANVFALGMGELELKSTLNQPLQAEIELTNIDDLTEWEIKPSLASDGDFDRAGVEKIFFLSDIDFEVKGNRIILSSDKSVTEPFLNFLVQVNWPSGRILREYTLLLDPPVFDEKIQPLAATELPKRVESQASVSTPGSAPAQGGWQTTAAEPGTYKVQPSDTLWAIAINTRPNRKISPQQMMLAIQDSNPGAFIGGNINRLKTHQVLRIPTEQQMAARDDGQAINEVMRQNRELQTAGAQLDATRNASQGNKIEKPQDGGELKLLAKPKQVTDSATSSGDIERGTPGGSRAESLQNDLAIALETLDTNRLENQDLKARLASLEEQIATLQRLVSLKDDQLASISTIDLQKEALETAQVNLETTAPVAEDAAIEEPAIEEPVSEQLVDDAAVDDTAVKDVAVKDVAVKDVAVEDVAVEDVAVEDFNYNEEATEAEIADTTAIAEAVQPLAGTSMDPAHTASQIQQQVEDRFKPKGFIAEMMAKPSILAGLAGAVALLLGLILLAFKKRRSHKEEEVDAELAAFDENFELGEEGSDEASLDDFNFDENEEVAIGHEPTDDLLEGIGSEADDELEASSDTVAQTADIIGEAEIYIAYGRFDQAADLLKNAIQEEPSRIDLRMKLLEVYTETDDATSFAEAELELNSIGDLEANEKAVAMRSRLTAPINGESEAPSDESIATGDEVMLDMEGLADSEDEFADGIDFEAALDLSDDDFDGSETENFATSLDALSDEGDDGALDFDLNEMEEFVSPEESSDLALADTDEVPTLDEVTELDQESELDEESELELDDEAPIELNEVETVDEIANLDLYEVPTLDEDSAIDLDEVPTLDEIPTLDEVPTLDEEAAVELDQLASGLDESFDDSALDLSDLEQELAAVDSEAANENNADDTVIDLATIANEDVSDIAELEDILNSDEANESLPDLSFDLEETGFANDAAVDDLQSLEVELGGLSDQGKDDAFAVESAIEEAISAEPVAEASAVEDLSDFADSAENSEFDLNELDDLPDFTAEIAEQDVVAEKQQAAQEIDLDELAASDDEFDYLAGTDECSTKLDLARAYLDMEDNDGAKELLQEVVAEGNDQQKQDARALMDSIG